MPKIKLNFRQLSIPEKVVRAQQIVAALEGNTNFPTPTPTLSQVTTAVSELQTADNDARAARTEAERRTAVRDQMEEELVQHVTRLGGYVESVAGGNEALITLAGFETRSERTTGSSPSTAPGTLTTTTGNDGGEIELSWDAIRNARSYIVECATDPQTGPWTMAGVGPRSSLVVEGLESGKRYYFRVAAVTLNGQSPWSNHAVKVAP